jgi:hypothetical protein
MVGVVEPANRQDALLICQPRKGVQVDGLPPLEHARVAASMK